MARIGRLAGAIWLATGGEHYLIGNPKEPCDFAAFEHPGQIDALARPFVKLQPRSEVAPQEPTLSLELEGEAAAARVAQLFLIERNGSVSERLWRLVTDHSYDGRWLGGVPPAVWEMVRERVLKCS
jgi:hypothetical protein